MLGFIREHKKGLYVFEVRPSTPLDRLLDRASFTGKAPMDGNAMGGPADFFKQE